MDKKQTKPTPSTVYKEIISDIVVKELKKAGIREEVIYCMLKEPSNSLEFVKEITKDISKEKS